MTDLGTEGDRHRYYRNYIKDISSAVDHRRDIDITETSGKI